MRRTAQRVDGEWTCLVCGEEADAVARFCPGCGHAAATSHRSGGAPAVFAVLSFLALSGLVIALWSAVWPGDFRLAYGPATAPEGTATLEAVDPRAVADNLFNHVVDAAAGGDSTELQAFLPLALMAYSEAAPLDADGLFHVSTLQRIGEMPNESLRSARGILEIDPDHLLGLGAAAVASETLGQTEDATRYYARFAQVFDEEVDRALTEYVGHSSFLNRVELDATSRVGLR